MEAEETESSQALRDKTDKSLEEERKKTDEHLDQQTREIQEKASEEVRSIQRAAEALEGSDKSQGLNEKKKIVRGHRKAFKKN